MRLSPRLISLALFALPVAALAHAGADGGAHEHIGWMQSAVMATLVLLAMAMAVRAARRQRRIWVARTAGGAAALFGITLLVQLAQL